VAWALARTVLGAHTGVPPAALQIDRTCPGCGAQHGKPRLPATPDLHVSVSHSGTCVVVAVLTGAAVGVDVEEFGQPDPDELEDTAGLVLAPEERRELARLPARHRAQAFATYWTRKEAVVKATGQGLTAPLAELVVSPPSAPPAVLTWRSAPVPLRELALHPLHPPAGSAATLAVVGGAPVRVAEADAEALLRPAGDGSGPTVAAITP
jgi:4'-phosphopantetheinyl transferase